MNMSRFDMKVLREIPADRSRRLDVVLSSLAPFESEAYHSVNDLEEMGLVVKTWNGHGNTFVQRTADKDEPEDCEHGLNAQLCAGPMHYPMGS